MLIYKYKNKSNYFVQQHITVLLLNGLLHFHLLSFIGPAIWPHFFFTAGDIICFSVPVS